MKMYDMRQQLKEGKAAERFLDTLFEATYTITQATRKQERIGIDRIFVHKATGQRLTIQYKADKRAGETGNAFVETVSVDAHHIPGWVYTCTADYLLYYVVGFGPIYVLRPEDLRAKLAEWKESCPSRTVPNKRYNTIGLLVSLDEFEKLATQVIDV